MVIKVIIIIIDPDTKGYSVVYMKYCSEQGEKNHGNSKNTNTNTNVEIRIKG
jgi:hypothetical protein